jgi:DNA-binding XRE family transcriptional regulator
VHESKGVPAKKSRTKPAPDAQANGRFAAEFLAALGREVRRGRAKRGMTRRQLALASHTSERYLAQIESGTGNPSVTVLRARSTLPPAICWPSRRRKAARARRSSRRSHNCPITVSPNSRN